MVYRISVPNHIGWRCAKPRGIRQQPVKYHPQGADASHCTGGTEVYGDRRHGAGSRRTGAISYCPVSSLYILIYLFSVRELLVTLFSVVVIPPISCSALAIFCFSIASSNDVSSNFVCNSLLSSYLVIISCDTSFAEVSPISAIFSFR